MFRLSTFDKNLENATSHLRLEPDWPSILLICDAIRQNDVGAKQAFQAIKKKMMSPNPHTAYYALLVLESVVKNCGSPMHEEISTKENCEMFSTFIEQTPHENVRQKMLELIQTWAYAFRSSEKYQAIKDTMTILKAKGHNFPELVEADAMFTADTAPDWADGKVCHRCRVEFSFTQRKHHCRNCGQIFCAQCSSKQCPLPKYGIEKEVRVCDGCFTQLQKPLSGKSRTAENDLPVEYLSSSLAQQSQTPPRKSEQELKEEEELQLALALSQSEAEQQKTKQTKIFRIVQKSPSTEAPPAPVNNPVPVEETPDPELAKYLNRSYWEQRKTTESPASPSAPSPMPQTINIFNTKISEEVEIDDFTNNMKSQVEIFVNRMKSNSSRGRNISNDSSVQTLFMNLTSLHSRLLTYIKDLDDKRMLYEQLQDKLNQVRDSRAALDVLRQEHIEKLRRIAEEQERQRQLQMAHKLEIMRKKKQEYLQYQRQLALQRIQEQEREMQIRQEQQKAQYRMGQGTFGFMPNQQNSPSHQIPPNYSNIGYSPNPQNPMQRFALQNQVIQPQNQAIQPQNQAIPLQNLTIQSQNQAIPLQNQTIQQQNQARVPSVPMPGMYSSGISPIPNQPNMTNVMINGQLQNLPANILQNQAAQGNIPMQISNRQQGPQMNSVPTSVIISNHPQGQNVKMLVVSGAPGIAGQNFGLQPGQNAPRPNTQNTNTNIQGIPPMVRGNQVIQHPGIPPNNIVPPHSVPPVGQGGQIPMPNSNSGQPSATVQHTVGQGGQIPMQNSNSGQPSATVQHTQPSTVNNNQISNQIQPEAPPKQEEEETKEVNTAELISFD